MMSCSKEGGTEAPGLERALGKGRSGEEPARASSEEALSVSQYASIEQRVPSTSALLIRVFQGLEGLLKNP